MVTLAPSSTPRVRDSAIEKIEVKLTHFKKKNDSNWPVFAYVTGLYEGL